MFATARVVVSTRPLQANVAGERPGDTPVWPSWSLAWLHGRTRLAKVGCVASPGEGSNLLSRSTTPYVPS